MLFKPINSLFASVWGDFMGIMNTATLIGRCSIFIMDMRFLSWNMTAISSNYIFWSLTSFNLLLHSTW